MAKYSFELKLKVVKA